MTTEAPNKPTITLTRDEAIAIVQLMIEKPVILSDRALGSLVGLLRGEEYNYRIVDVAIDEVYPACKE